MLKEVERAHARYNAERNVKEKDERERKRIQKIDDYERKAKEAKAEKVREWEQRQQEFQEKINNIVAMKDVVQQDILEASRNIKLKSTNKMHCNVSYLYSSLFIYQYKLLSFIRILHSYHLSLHILMILCIYFVIGDCFKHC